MSSNIYMIKGRIFFQIFHEDIWAYVPVEIQEKTCSFVLRNVPNPARRGSTSRSTKLVPLGMSLSILATSKCLQPTRDLSLIFSRWSPTWNHAKYRHEYLRRLASMTIWLNKDIDYRCETSSFFIVQELRDKLKPWFAFQGRETGVNRGIKTWKEKKKKNWMSSMSESHWWYLLYKEVKSWHSHNLV